MTGAHTRIDAKRLVSARCFYCDRLFFLSYRSLASSHSSPSSPLRLSCIFCLSFAPCKILGRQDALTMSFAPKPGCPMCGIVSSAVHTPANSPRSPQFPNGSTAPQILWRDENFTIYRELANPVSSKGHLIVVFKYVSVSMRY